MGVLDIDGLFDDAKNQSSARYIIRGGRRLKIDEYNYLDLNEKEALSLKDDVDWSSIDSKLDQLNSEWILEVDSLNRELLSLKYDFLIESFVGDEPTIITILKEKIKKLEKLISKVQ